MWLCYFVAQLPLKSYILQAEMLTDMKKNLLLIVLVIITCTLHAQKKNDNIAGEYYLRGVSEVASGFKLFNDSSFQFYFTYGALDRFGSGTWKSGAENAILLTTRERPGPDFAYLNSKLVEGDSITVRIVDKNKKLLPHIFCTLKSTDLAYEHVTDDSGEIKFPKQAIDSINFIFELASERSSQVCVELLNRNDNYFEYTFEPWVAEVFFDKLLLYIGDEKLTGSHPLLDGDRFIYFKGGKK